MKRRVRMGTRRKTGGRTGADGGGDVVVKSRKHE